MRGEVMWAVLAFVACIGVGVYVVIDTKNNPPSTSSLLIGVNPMWAWGVLVLIITVALLFIYFGGDEDVR